MTSTAPLAFITGASSGIGQALAGRFADAGYRLALVARRTAEIESWASARGMGADSYRIYSADVAAIDSDEAEKLLDLAALREVANGARDTALTLKGTRALDAFLLDPSAPEAASIIGALKRIAPNATTANDLAGHIGCPREAVDNALDMLSAIAAVDTMPRGQDRIARLHARLRAKISDIPVVALA